MKDLSFHITDIIQNSVRAGSNRITLGVTEYPEYIMICIADNGCGMDAETIRRISNPFYTTRTTRRVGLGIPFLIQNAEQTGGHVAITSVIGEGTVVTATFKPAHIDCPPWGNLSGTVAMTITGNPQLDIYFSYQNNSDSFEISTPQLREVLDDIPLSHPRVMLYLKGMIKNGTTFT